MSMPRGVDLKLEARFSPSNFELDTGGLSASLDLGSVEMNLAKLLSLLEALKPPNNQANDAADSGDMFSPSDSEAPMSPPLSPPLSPRSPGRLRSMAQLSVSYNTSCSLGMDTDPSQAFRRKTRGSELQLSKKRTQVCQIRTRL
jgi:hypothetical protein